MLLTTYDEKIRHSEKNLNLIQIQLLTIGKSNPNKKSPGKLEAGPGNKAPVQLTPLIQKPKKSPTLLFKYFPIASFSECVTKRRKLHAITKALSKSL